MKSISTLTDDIYHVLDATYEHDHDAALASEYAVRVGDEFVKATAKRDTPRERGKLWASDLGKKCLRQHWYNFNMPEAGEKLNGYTKFKFLYGNVLEEAVLYFAEESGHTVSDQQRRVEITLPKSGWTISGRIDAYIDGVLIDVKSTSSYGYKRYKDGITPTNDSFGYLSQLGFYKEFGDTHTDEAGFVWIDKQNGHVTYTKAITPSRAELVNKANAIIEAVDKQEHEVERGYSPAPYGKSGNESLPVGCSYCAYKQRCYKDTNGGRGLRGFVYGHGPVWFTKITKEPRVPEILEEE